MGILEKLVAFPTVSSASNLAFIDYVEDLLIQRGFWTERSYNEPGDKANLLARIGPEQDGGLMLAGHTDVVPVEGQAWQHEPFRLTVDGDRLIGRGTTDMKGFLALALNFATRLDPTRLTRPLYLAFTYDEEVGCLGAKQLLNKFSDYPYRPAFVLIGEPTDMQLVSAHKGLEILRTRIQGKPAHSSCPHLGSSAISYAAKMISRLPALMPAEQNPLFGPPGATFNIGTIQGGTASNIIAETCELLWEIRPLPGQDVASLEARLAELMADLSVELNPVSVAHHVVSSVPGLAAGANQAAIDHLQTFLKGVPITTAPFVTEAGLYQQSEIPAVVCGPGTIQQAHQPNEHVSLAAMCRYAEFLGALLDTLTICPTLANQGKLS